MCPAKDLTSLPLILLLPILLLLALTLAACASRSSVPSQLAALNACAGDEGDCPPVSDIMAPGYRVPVYKTIEEPIYEERRTAVWGEKTVAVYQVRRTPVTLTLPDSCTGCDRVVTLWEKEDKVQVGTKRVPACIGYKIERIKVGSCPKQVRVGWRTEAEVDPCAPVCPPAR